MTKILDLETRDGRIDIVDAEDRAYENPDSFEIPCVVQRHSLGEGDYAQVIFEFDAIEGFGGERLWLKVEKVSEMPGSYVGSISNDPIVCDLRFGDMVAFEARHIIDILEESSAKEIMG
tara:strand:- start:560 stop:916 length:357 start_codon:yes stop_codon:yes gene_type:complete